MNCFLAHRGQRQLVLLQPPLHPHWLQFLLLPALTSRCHCSGVLILQFFRIAYILKLKNNTQIFKLDTQGAKCLPRFAQLHMDSASHFCNRDPFSTSTPLVRVCVCVCVWGCEGVCVTNTTQHNSKNAPPAPVGRAGRGHGSSGGETTVQLRILV